MVNYQLGKIYKIVDNTNGNIYIGSTCEQYLSNRLGGHRRNYKKYLKGTYCYVTSYEIIKNGDFDIVLIEDFPCNDKMHLCARERHFIDTLECVNKVKPLRTKMEWTQDNKDHISLYQKEYRSDNKEHLNLYLKEYYDGKKDVLKIKSNEYYNENKNTISQKRKEKYIENKENLREMRIKNKEVINERRRQLYKLKKEQQENILEV